MKSRDKSQTVLIVDRETDFLEWARHQVEAIGAGVITATASDTAYRMFCEHQPDLVLAEMNLLPISGQELLIKIRKHSPNALVVIFSAFGTTQAVIETIKLGAFDFVRKEQLPFTLKVVVETALKARAEQLAVTEFQPQLSLEQHQDEIVGRSDAMQQVFKLVGRVAASDVPVMITGESGSGKELIARAVHLYSQRSHKTFLAINCAAIPEALLESELFGHEKGAFTSANALRIGRFEQCDGGTLFLDEIGEMPLATQSKLLRVLQDGEFSRVGGNQTLRTDVRIVAATNRDLEQEVRAKTFREDLFYRLNVVRVHLPPLRQRVEDIRLLAEYFLRRIANQQLKPMLKLSEEAIRALESYSWPGNVRELENTMHRASVLATTDVLLPQDIPLGQAGLSGGVPPDSPERMSAPGLFKTQPAPPPPPTDSPALAAALLGALEKNPAGNEGILKAAEAALTRAALSRFENSEKDAAKFLGITPAALRKLSGSSDTGRAAGVQKA